MKKIISLLIVFPLIDFGMELPSVEIKCVEGVSEIINSVNTTAQNVTMSQFMRNALLVTSTLKNPLGTGVSYYAQKGLSAAHPLMQEYVSTAMKGRLDTLRQKAQQIKDKIAHSWLPLNKERAQLEALEKVINSDVSQQLEIMKYGTYEQVQCSVHHIVTSLLVHTNSNFEEPPAFNKDVIDACREVLSTNVNAVPIDLMDMVTTSPHSSVHPSYYRKEVYQKISALDIENMGVDNFFEIAVEILNECKQLTPIQKKAFLAEFLHDIFEKNLGGRLAKTFGEQLLINLKANQFFKAGKFLCDWAFGYIYLTNEQLDAHVQVWIDGYEMIAQACNDIKNGNEARMHQIMKSSADILSSFPNPKLKKIKSVTTKGGGIVQAIERIT